jgi:pyridoxal phosphate enzyme (YggS family)
MKIEENIKAVVDSLGKQARLIAVTKTKPVEVIMEAYNAGIKDFGENKVQEMLGKYEQMPQDIRWHQIGHLQTNKVKYIAPFVSLIHSVDSFKLLKEINKQAEKNSRIIECLLQIYIADEETKFGLSEDEALEIINSADFNALRNIRIKGLMGMASNTEDTDIIRNEFAGLKSFFEILKNISHPLLSIEELSMGMSGDYALAIEEGSTLVRVGSLLFGER